MQSIGERKGRAGINQLTQKQNKQLVSGTPNDQGPEGICRLFRGKRMANYDAIGAHRSI